MKKELENIIISTIGIVALGVISYFAFYRSPEQQPLENKEQEILMERINDLENYQRIEKIIYQDYYGVLEV